MDRTRSGEYISPQIGKMGVIDGLNEAAFTLPNGQPFQLKNDGVQSVKLSVQLAAMDEGEWVETTFEVGWNPEIIKAIAQTSLAGYSLKWGY